MDIKHTPGPWASYSDGDNTIHISPKGKILHSIAILLMDKNSDEQFHANAKLIAAAPKLLQALNVAKRMMEEMKSACANTMTEKANYSIDLAIEVFAEIIKQSTI